MWHVHLVLRYSSVISCGFEKTDADFDGKDVAMIRCQFSKIATWQGKRSIHIGLRREWCRWRADGYCYSRTPFSVVCSCHVLIHPIWNIITAASLPTLCRRLSWYVTSQKPKYGQARSIPKRIHWIPLAGNNVAEELVWSALQRHHARLETAEKVPCHATVMDTVCLIKNCTV